MSTNHPYRLAIDICARTTRAAATVAKQIVLKLCTAGTATRRRLSSICNNRLLAVWCGGALICGLIVTGLVVWPALTPGPLSPSPHPPPMPGEEEVAQRLAIANDLPAEPPARLVAANRSVVAP